jgi:outer membrane protein OmpA-like peptidoglycan-associated protein
VFLNYYVMKIKMGFIGLPTTVFVFLLLAPPGLAVAQPMDPALLKKMEAQATVHRLAGEWIQAAETYQQLLGYEAKEPEMRLYLALSYFHSGLKDLAYEQYQYLLARPSLTDQLSAGQMQELYGTYAQVLHHQELYAQAQAYYQLVLERLAPRNPDRAYYEQALARCQQAQLLAAAPRAGVRLTHLPSAVNTRYDELGPRCNPEGNLLYFTSYRADATDQDAVRSDFFFTRIQDGEITVPRTAVAMDANAFKRTADQQAMRGTGLYYFPDQKPAPGTLYVSTGPARPVYARTLAQEVSMPVKLPAPFDAGAGDRDPFMDEEAGLFFFASKRKGGLGGYDIWVSQLGEKGVWMRPVHTGPGINTPYDERSPYYHVATRRLYFSSQGHDAMGGYDVFQSVHLDDDSYSTANNLGYPVNSPADDLGYAPYGKGNAAYLASDRRGSNGALDLYQVVLEEADPAPLAQGTATRATYTPPTDSLVPGLDEEEAARKLAPGTGEPDGTAPMPPTTGQKPADEPATALRTPVAGGTLEPALAEEVRKELKAYPAFFVERTLDKAKQYPEIARIQPGETLMLWELDFKPGTDEFGPSATSDMDKLFYMMMANPNMRVKITAHTDNQGAPAALRRLSERRAMRVVLYLVVNKGIDESRFEYKGKGGTEPRADNSTTEGRARNNRVEVFVLSK